MVEELSLDALRQQIDQLDDELVALLNQRAECAVRIGQIKTAQRLPIYEPQREAKVMARVKALNATLGGPLEASAIERVYERIIDEARRIQRQERERGSR